MTENVSDWHIDIDDPVGQSVAFPGQKRIETEFESYVSGFSQSIAEMQTRFPERDRFLLEYQSDRYRIQKIMNGKYAARKIRGLPSFTQLKIPKAYQQMLMQTELSKQGGLILFCGQTGSGKTYTMGTAFDVHLEDDEQVIGIIPRAVEHLFSGIQQRRQKAQDCGDPVPEFAVKAQFMEVLCRLLLPSNCSNFCIVFNFV